MSAWQYTTYSCLFSFSFYLVSFFSPLTLRLIISSYHFNLPIQNYIHTPLLFNKTNNKQTTRTSFANTIIPIALFFIFLFLLFTSFFSHFLLAHTTLPSFCSLYSGWYPFFSSTVNSLLRPGVQNAKKSSDPNSFLFYFFRCLTPVDTLPSPDLTPPPCFFSPLLFSPVLKRK